MLGTGPSQGTDTGGPPSHCGSATTGRRYGREGGGGGGGVEPILNAKRLSVICGLMI